jgi:ribosomal-protein-alanine N-acetyltransferase
MQNLSFRKMEKADLPAVVRIENDCQSHPWSLMQFLEGFHAGHSGWLATREVDGAELLVGFAIVMSVLDECSLLNICIQPDCQKQGFGWQLLEFVLARAAADNMTRMFLEVRASNKAAIRLYERAGFEQVSVRRDYYPAVVGREDGLVYILSSFSSGSLPEASSQESGR